jgi:hypothetical protein
VIHYGLCDAFGTCDGFFDALFGGLYVPFSQFFIHQ